MAGVALASMRYGCRNRIPYTGGLMDPWLGTRDVCAKASVFLDSAFVLSTPDSVAARGRSNHLDPPMYLY